MSSKKALTFQAYNAAKSLGLAEGRAEAEKARADAAEAALALAHAARTPAAPVVPAPPPAPPSALETYRELERLNPYKAREFFLNNAALIAHERKAGK